MDTILICRHWRDYFPRATGFKHRLEHDISSGPRPSPTLSRKGNGRCRQRLTGSIHPPEPKRGWAGRPASASERYLRSWTGSVWRSCLWAPISAGNPNNRPAYAATSSRTPRMRSIRPHSRACSAVMKKSRSMADLNFS